MIGIVDYGAGNIRSVQKAVERLGQTCRVVSRGEQIDACDAYILPGVGAFGAAMERLAPVKDCLLGNIRSGKYILGICLGMQLLLDTSQESGEQPGLHLIPGEVVRLDQGLKVPHMGWNKLLVDKEDELTKGVNGYVYFVHSYYAKPQDQDDIVLHAEYGTALPALVRRGNVIGMQFHPEKSGEVGMRLLKNYLELIV